MAQSSRTEPKPTAETKAEPPKDETVNASVAKESVRVKTSIPIGLYKEVSMHAANCFLFRNTVTPCEICSPACISTFRVFLTLK